MKPTKISILGIDHTIIYVEKPSDVDVHGREVLMGQIDYWTRTIRVHDDGRDIKDVWQILFHEILHGIAESLDLALGKEKHHAELDILSLAVCDTLIRNGLVKFADPDPELEQAIEFIPGPRITPKKAAAKKPTARKR